jgi:NAD(P)-dependent dehydrogenase (short-subunit alcohol dehydrogenase family)
VEKIAVVTGASGGIGGAIAERLSSEYRIVPIDLAGGVDATNPDQVEEALRGVDTIDALVHAAGTVGKDSLSTISVDRWNDVVDASLTSAFVVTKAAMPRLKRVPAAGIVYISSVMARHGGNDISGPAYAVAKAGIVALAMNAAKHLAPNIRANVIAPGPVRTVMVDRLTSEELDGLLAKMPLHRVAEPSEIAEVTAFLLGDGARTITGAVIDVNGGMWMG